MPIVARAVVGDGGYLKGSVEENAPAPVTKLLVPIDTAVPPFSKLIPVGLA
jgi:hypothetical protein